MISDIAEMRNAIMQISYNLSLFVDTNTYEYNTYIHNTGNKNNTIFIQHFFHTMHTFKTT